MSSDPALQQTTLPGLRFGALSPSLAEQLADVISTDEQREKIAHLDRDADAVTRLKLRGLIAEGVANKARGRIAKAAWRVLA